MLTEITSGVRISVDCRFEANLSNPLLNQFIFSYRITIENQNEFPIQLLRRHWFIFDSNATRREVEGEGVVGVQPVILPGETYRYVSGCNLKTEMGRMVGTYEMENLDTREQFTVQIPSFEMIVPYKNN